MTGLINAWKQHNQWHLTALFADTMVHHITHTNALPHADYLVPVPSGRWREFWRGANPAALLADELSRQLAIPTHTRLIRKQRNTPRQAQLGVRARQTNLRGAFQVTADVRGLRLILVDDVMTTGSTLRELAATLRAAGALEVYAWCLARAVKA